MSPYMFQRIVSLGIILLENSIRGSLIKRTQVPQCHCTPFYDKWTKPDWATKVFGRTSPFWYWQNAGVAVQSPFFGYWTIGYHPLPCGTHIVLIKFDRDYLLKIKVTIPLWWLLRTAILIITWCVCVRDKPVFAIKNVIMQQIMQGCKSIKSKRWIIFSVIFTLFSMRTFCQ